MLAKLAAFTACISGCYYQFPHEIKRQPMTPSPTAQIELRDMDHTEYFHDCDSHPTGCIEHDGELVRPDHYIETTATYDGKSITRGQVAELVDPDAQAKRYAELAKYESTCDISLVPSTVFAVGALADLVGVGAISSTSSEIPVYLLVGGAIAMVAGAALSYPLGGYACTHGRRVAEHSGIDADMATSWFTHDDEPASVEREHQLRAEVDAFNARHGGGVDRDSVGSGLREGDDER